MSDRNRMTARIAELLEASGLSPAEARARAAESVDALATVAPGTGYGHLHPAELANVWHQAARAGRRRLVLEVSAEADALEDDTGRVNVRVLEAENWPEWTEEHTRQRAATDALLRHAPALGLSETDYMAHGEDCPDVWTPDALARTAKELN